VKVDEERRDQKREKGKQAGRVQLRLLQRLWTSRREIGRKLMAEVCLPVHLLRWVAVVGDRPSQQRWGCDG
jgi:hypothetical protein